MPTIKRNLVKRNLVLVFLIFALIISFGFGFWVGEKQLKCKICSPEEVDFSLFWEAWDKLQKNYVNPEVLDVQKMIYGAISGMVESLGDPYTVFFNPEESKTFLEDVSGRFEGVGTEIGIRKGQLQVIAPLEGTPAQKADLRPGDKIIKIGDVATADISSEEAVSLIRGPKGTEVTLTIMRDGWDAPKEITIERKVIEIPSSKWELLASPGEAGGEGDIAYIKLYQFSENIDSDFRKIAAEVLNSPAKKIILDLRNNPGGYLERAQDIAGWFLEKGQVVVIEDFGAGKKQTVYKADGNAKLIDYPMVILINQGSASASEILASALHDNRGIKMIGETSFGKGSVQKLETLTDDSSLKITIAKWLTPKGASITDVGLEPDIKVEMTDEDYKQGRDPQLDKAIEIVKELK